MHQQTKNHAPSIFSVSAALNKIMSEYGFYAKSAGVNLVTIHVLELISASDEPYTQKELCEKLKQPKQLVNSIISTFWEQGYVELREAKDRRTKKVILTDKGKQYAIGILMPLHNAENTALNCFSTEEISQLIMAVEKYEKSLSSYFQNSLL